MDNMNAQSETIDLVTNYPGRTESRLVLNVNADRFDNVVRKIAAVWGMAGVPRCAITYFCSEYDTVVEISSQEEWTFLLKHGFFRSPQQHVTPLMLDFHTQVPPSSMLELRIVLAALPLAEAIGAKKELVHDTQAAEIEKLNATNDRLSSDNMRLKEKIDAQARDFAAKSASADALQARHDQLEAKYDAQREELAGVKTVQAQEIAKLNTEIARIKASYDAQSQELAKVKAANSASSSQINGKRSYEEVLSDGERDESVEAAKKKMGDIRPGVGHSG